MSHQPSRAFSDESVAVHFSRGLVHDPNNLLKHALVVLVDFGASHLLNVRTFAGAFNSSKGGSSIHNGLHS